MEFEDVVITTAEQLNETPCVECGDKNCEDGMELISRCHPKAGCNAVYKQGCVALVCAECDTFIVGFRII